MPIRHLRDMAVRLAQPHERPIWDHLMHEYHDLGFQQSAGRGLRYIAEWRRQ